MCVWVSVSVFVCLSLCVSVSLCVGTLRRYMCLLCLFWLHSIYDKSFAIWPLLSIKWSSAELQILQWQAAILSASIAHTLNCQMRKTGNASLQSSAVRLSINLGKRVALQSFLAIQPSQPRKPGESFVTSTMELPS